MKKIAYLFLVFLIALAMASCNDSVAVDDDTSSSEEDAPVSDVSGLPVRMMIGPLRILLRRGDSVRERASGL